MFLVVFSLQFGPNHLFSVYVGGTASLEDLVDFILSTKGDGSIGDNAKSANHDNSEVVTLLYSFKFNLKILVGITYV